jgi:hypothetical protein
MGEPAEDGETRDSQDRLGVDLAGAGRKYGCLSWETCCAARGLATGPATGREGVAGVSRGHSTRPAGRGAGEGPNSQSQGTTERLVRA